MTDELGDARDKAFTLPVIKGKPINKVIVVKRMLKMPILSMFYGIVIYMYCYDNQLVTCISVSIIHLKRGGTLI